MRPFYVVGSSAYCINLRRKSWHAQAIVHINLHAKSTKYCQGKCRDTSHCYISPVLSVYFALSILLLIFLSLATLIVYKGRRKASYCTECDVLRCCCYQPCLQSIIYSTNSEFFDLLQIVSLLRTLICVIFTLKYGPMEFLAHWAAILKYA